MSTWGTMVLVGRVARPHGLRGHVVINPDTDFAEERFAVGATVWMAGDHGPEPLVVRESRLQGARPVVRFDGMARVEDVERLAGRELRIPESALAPLEPGTYYHHELIGCAVETATRAQVGIVARVDGGAGGSLLVVAATGRDGKTNEVLIPLAVDICTTIDTAGKRIVVQPPEGLLDLNEIRHRHDLPEDDRRRAGRGRRRPGNRTGPDRPDGA